MRTPRPYQQKCFDAARDAFKSGLRHIILVLATGLGKTVIFVLIALMVRAKGGRVLILVNRDVLCRQAAEELSENGMHPVIECGTDKASPLADLVVGSIQTMASGNRIEKWNRDHFRMVICDECFLAGTIIETEFGPLPIEEVPPGIRIWSFNHATGEAELARVVNMQISSVSSDCIASVSLDDGRQIACTHNHPFWNGESYSPASELTCDDAVLSMARYGKQQDISNALGKMQVVSSECDLLKRTQGNSKLYDVSGSRERGRLLLERMPGRRILGRDSAAQTNSQSDETARGEGQAVNYIEGDGMEASDSRRKRETASNSPASTCVNSWVENGVCNQDIYDARERLAHALQNGHRTSRPQSRDRDRRRVALLSESSRTGSSQGIVLESARLANSPIPKFRSNFRSSQVRETCIVYNFEVESNHNYFANGILVHNCHGSSAATFAKVLDHFESAFHVGVTATPNRHDKKGLWRGYEKIVFEMPLKERTVDGLTVPGGIEEGWLCDLVFKPVPVPITISDKAAKCRSFSEDDEAGDYGIGPFLQQIIERSIDEYRGEKVLNFFPNCTSSKESADAYKRAGLNARHIEGPGGPAGMTPKQIQETIEWFKGEKEAMLCNAQLLSVGYNQPDITTIGLTRMIKSETQYLQSLGRGTRTIADVDAWAEGTAVDRRCAIQFSAKPFCKVVDLVIQNEEHNLCEPAMLVTDDKEEREYIREARKIGKQIDLNTVDEMLRAKRQTDREKAMAQMTDAIANAAIKASRGEKKFGPYLGHILKIQTKPHWKPVSEKQRHKLSSLGFNGIAPSGYHASRIIDAYLTHRDTRRHFEGA